ncbi:copper homeostasis membrane protein CopD [Devosia submarina]|uniref:copper homeostasis membrane protein CopD n=1 Tax=Devosia submarina TaxID=1173082 RepID=UPI000D36A02B|nr:copper homeostasis membrane protein CopD [Devosia submarina]
MDQLLYAVRFLHYSAALQLFGLAIFQTWIAPPRLQRTLAGPLRQLAIVAATILLVSGVAWLMLMAGTMGSGWTDTVNPVVINAVASKTSFGQVWLSHLLISASLLPLAVFGLGSSAGWAALSLLCAFALGSLGLIGHATIVDGFVGLLNRLSHVLHALSSGFWLGSLLPLLLSLKSLSSLELGSDANLALRKFSGLGHYAVAIALATGVFNSWIILRQAELNIAVPYQALLAVKVGLVGVMLVLALVNRYIFVPRIPNNGPGARLLWKGTVAEIFVSAAIIALLAVLGVLSPT